MQALAGLVFRYHGQQGGLIFNRAAEHDNARAQPVAKPVSDLAQGVTVRHVNPGSQNRSAVHLHGLV